MPFVRRPPEPSLRRPARPEPPSAQEAAEAELRRELERRHEVLLEEGRRTRRATPSGAPRVVGAADLALVNALFASVNFINRRVGRQTYRSGGVGVKPMLGRLMASLSGFLEGRRP